MSFWSWAVTAYERPGVAECCLDLQDTAGQNVPLLLWAGWSGATDPETVEAAVEIARTWDEVAVRPLRAVRWSLKIRRADMEDAAREALRAEVKAVELSAERALMEALEALVTPANVQTAVAVEPLAVVARAWCGQVPRDALRRLVDMLSG